MVQNNHSALTQGLKLYTDGMRQIIKQRLVAAFPNNWWEQGVLPAVSEQQRTNLRRDAAKDPSRDKADLLDPAHFVPVVTRHFNAAFSQVFHDYKKTQAWLRRADIARIDSAHPRSGDMLADEVAIALYDMVQLMRLAQIPEAEDVEAIRRDVLRLTQEQLLGETTTPAEEPPTSRQGQLPYWWEVCTPERGSETLPTLMSLCSPPRWVACLPARRERSSWTQRISYPTPISLKT